MKTKILFTIVLISFLSSTNNIQAERINKNPSLGLEQERTKSFNVNKGGKLVVNVNPGEIKINTWDKNEVVIKVRGLEEDELDNVKMSQSGNTVTVRYKPEWGWGNDAEFIVSVPSQFSLEAKTSGGDISINSDVTGEVDLNTMGGEITTRNIKGNTKLNTQGGDIRLNNIDGNLNVNTMGGDIRIGDIKGDNTRLNTMGGDIRVGVAKSELKATTFGGNIEINGIGGNADVNTMGGNIQVQNVEGNIKLDTKGGNVRARNVKGSVSAVTFAGQIDLTNITGSVDAKTMSGGITIEINPAQNTMSRITTQNGEIEIILPSSAKAEIEAEIRSWGNWGNVRDGYTIKSDFKANDSSDSENNKRVKKLYIINGGGGKIEAKATNGDISIRKK